MSGVVWSLSWLVSGMVCSIELAGVWCGMVIELASVSGVVWSLSGLVSDVVWSLSWPASLVWYDH